MEPGSGSGALTGHLGRSTSLGAGLVAGLVADAFGEAGLAAGGDRWAREESGAGRCAFAVDGAVHGSPTSNVRKAAVATDKTRRTNRRGFIPVDEARSAPGGEWVLECR